MARRVFRWPSWVVFCGLAAVLAVGHEDAQASHCGSYVIANPATPDGGKEIDLDRTTASKSHVPTPCEHGECREAPPTPLVPPSVPNVRTSEHVLLQVFQVIDFSGEQLPDLLANSACARAGFYRQLEHPPDASFC